jgi:SpoVK/Ycf46/Vps4 family AAA+-type ATPase
MATDTPVTGTRMSLSTEFETLVANLLKARFPILYIPTWEEDRVISTVSRIVSDEAVIKTPRQLFTWSVTTGVVGNGTTANEETKSPMKALELVEKHPEPAVFIFKDLHTFFGAGNRQADPQIIRRVRDIVPVLKQSARPINMIFVAPSLVLPNDLQKDVAVIDFDLPSFDEIHSVLQEMIDANRQTGRIVIDLKEQESERLAKAALGLTLQEAENAFARAMVEDGRLDIHDVEVILDEKQQIIRKTEILEFIKSDFSIDDVGGLENLKRWLNKRDKSWLDDAKRYCLPAPKGVLITGVPGCGKSLVAKAISAMWQLPLLRLDIGRIFSGIVGSSEENIRTAIRTAEAISPSILWIDEIEKGFSNTGSSGDSGTSTRVFGTFLTWMQEKTKPVFVIATANNINALPPEMLRKGRFDEIFFVDLPVFKERVDIFAVHMKKRLRDKQVTEGFKLQKPFLEKLAGMTEGFVGAEIEHAVIAALFEAFSEDRAITKADFEKVIEHTVPLSVTQHEQIRAIRDWANLRAVAATRKEDRAEYGSTNADDKESDIRSTRGGRTVDF